MATARLTDLEPLEIPVPRRRRAPRALGNEAPLRLVRFGEAEIAVPADEHRAAALAVRAALWMVQYWGLASVDAVAERARALGADASASGSLVSRLLSGAPSTRWLDWPDRRWFSLATPTSQLGITVRKILSVATSVPLADLRDGLMKVVPAIVEAPSSVIEEYLRQMVGCTVEAGNVQLADRLPADDAALSPAEAALVEILEQAGGVIERSALRRRALEASLPEATARRVLKISPLFLSTPDGFVRLIGRGQESILAPRTRPRLRLQPLHA